MRQVIVKDRQNIVDLAIMYYGSAAGMIDLCKDNDLELDDNIAPGTVLNIQDSYPTNADPEFADYIKSAGIVIVSIKEVDITEVLGTNNDEFIITNDNDYIQA